MDLPPPLAQEMPVSSSKSSNLESALDDIKDDVHGVIGIWGMGGVGKTHLLKQINNELCRDRAFDVVLFVTCSQGCSEEKIQNEIIVKLHLEKNGSMEQKQSRIYNFLRERKFVLLLDDLWSRVDLNKIGIPYPMNIVGTCKRKIVLTTRSTEVCGQMEVKKRIRVDVLKWDDAWSLFKEMVAEETINSDPLIQKSAVDVVNELGGLPLALITIGRAMSDKMDPSEWEHAVGLLKQARLNDVEFSCEDQSVFFKLRFSYDSLKNDTLKQCFLHCSLWPEDHRIWKDSLVELWMGLGLIDEPRMQDAYNLGHNYIRRLQAVCLLESDGDNFVNMHDVIRDMAIWIINKQGVDLNKWIVRAGTYDKPQEIEVFRNTEKLSFMFSHAKEVCLSLTCSSTKLSVLLLASNLLNNSKSLRLELFSELTILNLSHNRLEAFPVEICNLVHLQFLNLSCNPFRSLSKELANLTKLKYLHLRATNCTFSKSVLSELKVLRLLDLSFQDPNVENYIEIFPTIEEDLQCLSNFQALGITISNMHIFRKFFQTVSVPVRWLDIYNYNESCFPFSSFFGENFQLQNNLYSLKMKDMDVVEFVEFERANANRGNCLLRGLEYLDFYFMRDMKEVIWKSLDPKDVFPRLQTLEFIECPKLKSISWVVNLPCIRELLIYGSKVMKQLICINELESSGIIMSQHSFPFLKELILLNMYELEIISDPIITFPVLEVLQVRNCDKLKKLPFKSSDPTKKLKSIRGSIEWWNNVEMEDGSSKSSLQPFFISWL